MEPDVVSVEQPTIRETEAFGLPHGHLHIPYTCQYSDSGLVTIPDCNEIHSPHSRSSDRDCNFTGLRLRLDKYRRSMLEFLLCTNSINSTFIFQTAEINKRAEVKA